jgi:hypothetical protein
LGNLLYAKVEAIVGDKKKAPKINGMLIDFEVFEVTDIIEFVESHEELVERVKEAENLINNKSKEPSPDK